MMTYPHVPAALYNYRKIQESFKIEDGEPLKSPPLTVSALSLKEQL
jgi:hypothetical protein